MENAFSFRDTINEYQGNSALIVFFLVALIYIIYFANNVQIKRYIMVAAMAVVLVFNNISLNLWKTAFGKEIVYLYFSALPCLGCSAYMICHIFKEMKSTKERIIFGMVVVAVLFMGGDIDGAAELINHDRNDSVNRDIEEISSFLKSGYKNLDSRATVLCSKECYNQMRTYNSLMLSAVGNEVFDVENIFDEGFEYQAMRLVNYGFEEDRESAIEMVDELGIDYIVISDEYNISDYLAKLSFFKVVDKETFDLYQKQDYDLNYGLDGYIRRLYFYLLKRKCTQKELEMLESAYLSEAMSFSEIAVFVMDTEEYKAHRYSREDMIYLLYEAMLDRRPNEGDIAFMTSYLGDIEDKKFIVEQYMNGEEFSNLINKQ